MFSSFPRLLIGRTAVHSGKGPAFVAYDQFLSTGILQPLSRGEVHCGSKPVKLGTSKCFQVCLRKRTFDLRVSERDFIGRAPRPASPPLQTADARRAATDHAASGIRPRPRPRRAAGDPQDATTPTGACPARRSRAATAFYSGAC